MRHPREPETTMECNEEIQYMRSIIAECERCMDRGEEINFEGRDFKEVIQTSSDRIQEMKRRIETIARPWEKSRPSGEVRLEMYGVTI